MGNGCAIHGWNLIASSSADSQIAGVLAGFVFTSMVLLLGRSGSRNNQTLGLFCAAFIVLGIDSHLFGVVSGDAPDRYCGQVWNEELTAAGMLAVGAMAIITGVSWLLASYFDSIEEPDEQEGRNPAADINLDRMIRIMAYGVGATVTLLLASTTYDYLALIFPSHQPWFVTWLVLVSPIVVFMASAGIRLYGSWLEIRKHRPKMSTSNRALKVAAYGILGYAVVGPVSTGVISELGKGWWRPPSHTIIAASIGVGLILPAILLTALISAVPPVVTTRSCHQARMDAERLAGIHAIDAIIKQPLRKIKDLFIEGICRRTY